ncbi:DUF4126 domain-containing protein [Acanthopleuribacter pedis]|uniref:DUF4126 domain-containing protein n=1 Tax=Acanthopleuribacter pedis TaxID=442870 RepID=A0A8J7U7A3_9BACT|nr:DUF4126 domain-containing protein [Acanthopleuribacter pedis]MBO1322784.1 DUF4126 domain-containing protein [Acanthopleuribacter pedis]
MEELLALMIGVGLAAACGFRIFVPILGLSLAANTGHVELSDSFLWLGEPTAAAALAIATCLEIGAYYIPWLDNLLDTAASPCAVVAGVIATGAMTTDMSPLMMWSTAVIAGGGTSAFFQFGSTITRQISTLTTGGLGNPVIATAELGGSIVMTVLAILFPVLAMAALLVLAVLTFRAFGRWRAKKAQAQVTAGTLA